MASLSEVPVLFLLLLLCGPGLREAHEVNAQELLETLSLLSGHYSNSPEVVDEFEHFQRQSNDVIDLLYKPLDIPPLNQRYPFVFYEFRNGVPLREGIILFSRIQDGLYEFEVYNITSPNKFRNGDASGSDLTLGDLAVADPVCTVRMIRAGVFAIQFAECFVDTEEYTLSYKLVHSCTTLVADFDPMQHAPERNHGVPYVFVKDEQFYLPDRWLKGNEDYVSPCGE